MPVILCEMEHKVDRGIGATSVMWALYQIVVVEKALSPKAKLSIYNSVYIPALTYDCEF